MDGTKTEGWGEKRGYGGDETDWRACDWGARGVALLLLNLLEMKQSQARNSEVSVKATDFSALT